MFGLGMHELIIIGVVAVLLFGKRLPEVTKSLGKSYREFRSGLTDIQSQVDFSDSHISAKRSYSAPKNSSAGSSYDDYDDHEEATAPKFEPPPSAPTSNGSPQAEPAAEPTTADSTTAESTSKET